jgi:hypothetical protein
MSSGFHPPEGGYQDRDRWIDDAVLVEERGGGFIFGDDGGERGHVVLGRVRWAFEYLCREKYSRRSCDFAFAMLRSRRLSAVLQRTKILNVSQESYTFLINCYLEL